MTIKPPRIFLFIFFSFVFAFGLVSCKNNKEDASAKGKGKPQGLRAEAFIVTPAVFQKDFSTGGTLKANEEIEIHPEISGRITPIGFNEGSYIRKGQTLINIYDADIIAQIRKLNAQRRLQQQLLNRQEELVKIGGISRQDYETTQAQISSIDADIAYQQAQLRKTKIVAPFDGRIGLRNVSPGAVVSPATLIATLQQVNPLKMDFSIPDQYRSSINIGKVVFFQLNNVNESLNGKIEAIEPGTDVNTRAIRVRAIVPNPSGKLSPGSFAQVKIPFESANTAILIPSQAIIPTTREKKVAIVRKGKAELVVVQLGTRTEDKVEITNGLVAGDTVITTGIMQVKPGMNVKITKVRT
jgi:membrane fusion protein, multidrug efflux system